MTVPHSPSGAAIAAVLAATDGPLAAGFAHAATSLVERGAWCAWTWGAYARALIRAGRDSEAEGLVDRLDALPLPADGPTGAVARFAHRETLRLRLTLRAPAYRQGEFA